jgi:hypothetical protein
MIATLISGEGSPALTRSRSRSASGTERMSDDASSSARLSWRPAGAVSHGAIDRGAVHMVDVGRGRHADRALNPDEFGALALSARRQQHVHR